MIQTVQRKPVDEVHELEEPFNEEFWLKVCPNTLKSSLKYVMFELQIMIFLPYSAFSQFFLYLTSE